MFVFVFFENSFVYKTKDFSHNHFKEVIGISETKKKKEKKVYSPEERSKNLKNVIENSLINLMKIEKDKKEEISFLLTMFHSVFSPHNPNLYQKFLESLGSKD